MLHLRIDHGALGFLLQVRQLRHDERLRVDDRPIERRISGRKEQSFRPFSVRRDNVRRPILNAAIVGALLALPGVAQAQAQPTFDFRVLATSRTSTMEREMNDAAEAGYRYAAVMGGETAVGGNEVVSVMMRPAGGSEARYEYQLLATNRTSTMERELREAAERGFEYRGQTVFESAFGGREVVCILERRSDQRATTAVSYRLLATSRTSTLQKELQAAGLDGYEVVGMTVGKTTMGGNELVAILRAVRP